jgi:hypothetical protein
MHDQRDGLHRGVGSSWLRPAPRRCKGRSEWSVAERPSVEPGGHGVAAVLAARRRHVFRVKGPRGRPLPDRLDAKVPSVRSRVARVRCGGVDRSGGAPRTPRARSREDPAQSSCNRSVYVGVAQTAEREIHRAVEPSQRTTVKIVRFERPHERSNAAGALRHPPRRNTSSTSPWRCQHRLYRITPGLGDRGKPANVAAVAAARQLACILWAAMHQ